MADEIYTVSVPDLPAFQQATGEEMIAVYRDNRLGRITQGSLRGTRTLSGPSTPPVDPSVLMALMPILGDRWRNSATGDEWKITALQPNLVWTPDGNVKGSDGVSNTPGPPGTPGRKGDKGDAGNLAYVLALTDVPADTAVVSVGSVGCIPADYLDDSHRGRVLGIVHTAVRSGGIAVIYSGGALDGVSGSFSADDGIFIGSGGRLTGMAPTTGWRQQLGTAASTTRIVINLGPAYDLPDAASLLINPDTNAIANILIGAFGADVFDRVMLAFAETIPFLPEDGTIPSTPGRYRRGSPQIYDVVFVNPQA